AEMIELAERANREGLSVRTVGEIVALRKAEIERDNPLKEKKRKRAVPRAGGRLNPAISELAERLGDRFDTSVSIDVGQKKGKIVVEFATLPDLERILAVMAPGEGRINLHQSLMDEADED